MSSADREALLADLLEEIARQVDRREPVDLDAYALAYPQYDDRLRRLIPAMRMLSEMEPSHATIPGEAGGIPAAFSTGQLGDFRLVREVGRGGMGVVYEAEQISLGRRVALKVLPFAAVLDEKQLTRFKNEARAAGSFHHPNIVPVFSVGVERGVHYYAMQFIDGQSLAEVIGQLRAGEETHHQTGGTPESSSSSSRLPVVDDTQPIAELSTEVDTRSPGYFRTVARLGFQAAEALQHAHDNGVLHRDIKPGNLLVTAEAATGNSTCVGEATHLWITDFGLARIGNDAGMTMSGDLLGTLRYMSPEQALGKRVIIDGRSDLYSLGVTFYELLALRPAFDTDDRRELIRQIANEVPPPPRVYNPAIPRDLETIVLKATDKDPSLRYNSAQELADDLRRFLDHKPIRARRPSPVEIAGRWCRRHASLVAGVAGALVLAVVGLSVASYLIWSANERTKAALSQVEAGAASVRRLLYASDIGEAMRHWQAGEIARANDLLDRHVPAGGQDDLRGYEWHFVRALCDAAPLLLQGHVGDVYAIAFSPDGDTITTAGKDGVVRLWSANDAQPLQLLDGHTDEVNAIVFAPDGRTIISAGDDHTVKLWDARSGQARTNLRGHESPVTALAISGDGAVLASGDKNGQIKYWDLPTQTEIQSFPAHSQQVGALAFDANAATLYSAGDDNIVLSWNGDDLESSCIELHHPKSVNGLSLLAGGRWLATGCEDGILRIWDTKAGSARFSLGLYDVAIQWIASVPDQNLIAIATDDGTVGLWKLDTGFNTARLHRVVRWHSARVWSVAFSPDGQRFATASRDGTVCVGTVSPNRHRAWVRSKSHGRVVAHALSADGGKLAVCFEDGQCVLADAMTGRVLNSLTKLPDVEGVQLGMSPDGRIVVALVRQPPRGEPLETADDAQRRILAVHSDGRTLATTSESRQPAWLSGRPSGDPRALLMEPLSLASSGAFSPIDRNVAFGMTNGHLELSDYATHVRHRAVQAHGGLISAVAYSPDGELLATGSHDGTAKLWDAATLTERAQLSGHRGPVLSVAFSGDGRTLATAGSDHTVRLWHVATSAELLSLEADELETIEYVAFTPDNRRLVASGLTADGDLFAHAWATGPRTVSLDVLNQSVRN